MNTVPEYLLQDSKGVNLSLGYASISVEFMFATPKATVEAFNELVKLTAYKTLVITLSAVDPASLIPEEKPGSVEGVICTKTIKLPGVSGEAFARQGFVKK